MASPGFPGLGCAAVWAYAGLVRRRTATILILSLALAGCGVKPPLRYVAPDDSLHDVAFQPRQPAHGAVEFVEEPSEELSEGPDQPHRVEPPPRRSKADVARHHYASAVGLQAACRHDEALAHLRGYLAAEPDGEYAASALVRMAEIHLDPAYTGNDGERARSLLSEVVARFPDSAPATVARRLLGTL